MTDMRAYEQAREQDAGFGDYFALLKPRVMSLVVFTALVGLLVAPVPVNPVVALASILFIALGGGASGALNMWWDADIDRLMRRTRKRPIPAGRVTEGEAFAVGVALSAFAVVMLFLAAGSVAAGLLLGAASLVVHLQFGHGPGAPEPMLIGQFVRVHPAYGIVLLISLLGFGAWLLSRAG
jgi:protoheme IX farnesyltransferase